MCHYYCNFIQFSLAILCQLILISSICYAAENEPVSVFIKTKLGSLRGFRHKIEDKLEADVFLNIPYAIPPLGELRFEKPRPIGRWNDVRDATKFGPSCYPHAREVMHKDVFTYSEDCLTLNIIRPSQSFDEDLPVLVWVHGGGYEAGTASMFGYKDFANIYIPHEIIVVSIQYRLGFLGFLTTADKAAPGNMGLFDQALALKWIYENIETFGGDKNRIRTWGLSAGGSSVSQLSLSPYSQQYVNGSFEMSGVAWNNWALGKDEDLTTASKTLGVSMGCVRDIKDCLKKANIELMYDAMTSKVGIKGSDFYSLKFTPRIDGDFFPDHPTILARTAKRRSTSVIGLGPKESAFFVLYGLAPTIHSMTIPKEDWPKFNRQTFIKWIDEKVIRKSEFLDSAEYVLDKIVEHYGSGAKDDNDYLFYLDAFNRLISDVQFAVGAVNAIMAKANEGWPVYAYSFEHYNEKVFKDLPEPLRGSTHCNEYPYMFNIFIFGKYDIDLDPTERQIRDVFRSSLISFVTTGIPDPDGEDWPAVTPTDDPREIQYLRMLPEPKIGKGLHVDAHKFWTDLKYDPNNRFDAIEFRRTDKKTHSQRDEL